MQLKHFIGLLLSYICLEATGQNTGLPAVQAAFNNFQKDYIQEKVYVHTDKSFYLAGELVWFKVYCVDASANKPLDMSKVAYVEILDRMNKPVMQAKVALDSGSGHGSFLLPTSIISGTHTFRAYTAWMKNFSADLYFTKPITIINTVKATGVQEGGDTASFNATFFPEGGNLVAGLKSKVGFKVTDRYGKGISFSGVLVSEQGDTAARFSPFKFGIGSFVFTPLTGQKYKAIITPAKGKPIQADLPEVYKGGYVMQVIEQGQDQLKVTVTTNIAGVESGGDIYLLVNNRKQVQVALQAVFQNGLATFTVDKANLEEGVSRLTLFDRQRQPLCERLVFKKPAKNLAIDVKTDVQQYAKRHKVTAALDIKPNTAASPADLSVAVFRLDSLTVPDGGDIANFLWLSSDLDGIIESPDYYFSDSSSDVSKASDNLMLTHGWRSFQWSDVLKGVAPAFQFAPEYNGHIIAGKITGALSGAQASGVGAYLSIPGTSVQLYSTQSNNQGKLAFQTKPFYGPNELVVQTKANEDSAYKIELNNPFSDKYASFRLPDFQIPTALQQALVRRSVHTQVQQNFAMNDWSRFALSWVDSMPFFGKATKQYQLDNYTRFATMEEVLREYVMEVGVRKRGNNYFFPVSQPTVNGFYDGDPLVLLDGVPVFDNNKIIGYDPLKVRKLEVVTNRYYFGPFVFDGVVSLTTYNGLLEGFQLDPGAIVMDYEGLQLRRQFHSPVYDTPERLQSRLPDFRSLLFFAPELKSDAAGKTGFSFYTSDVAGKYMIVVQGINKDGFSGSKHVVFEVK